MQPPATLKALADPIYEAFYGLKDEPFSITTDPKFFYLSASHELAFNELLNGLRRREGLLMVTGETGTGKTTLCRAVIQELGPRTFSAMILNPYMSGPEIFRIVLRDFGLVSHEDLRRGALATADLPQLLDAVEGFLRSLVPLEAQAVIVLDEAQALPPQVLDNLRMLTAIEHNNRRLVQIVLCGQPGLLKTLSTEPMYALNERVTRRVSLVPLPAHEVQAYIQHRLSVAGGADSVSFSEAAGRLVAELAHGLPRRVNVLCDRALQEGRIAGVNVIAPEHIKKAARSLAGLHEPPVAPEEPPAAAVEEMAALALGEPVERPRRLRPAIFAVVGGVAAAAILTYGWMTYRTATAGVPLVTPAQPARDVGNPVAPLPVPLAQPEPLRRSIAPDAGPPSGQIPDNSNQFN